MLERHYGGAVSRAFFGKTVLSGYKLIFSVPLRVQLGRLFIIN